MQLEINLKKILSELRGFKFVTALVLVFKKIEREDKTKYDTFYSHSKAETIINETDIDDVFQSIYTTIISNIQKSLGKGSLSKELDNPRKVLINIQNIVDSECFKWCLVRYLNPADHHPARTTKADKDFVKKLNFKDIISSQS